jgi:hypothetical protein
MALNPLYAGMIVALRAHRYRGSNLENAPIAVRSSSLPSAYKLSNNTNPRADTMNWVNTVTTDEELLLDFFHTGDAAAIDELAARYDRKLAGFLYFLLGDTERAADVLNDVWTDLYLSRRDRLRWYARRRGPAEGWLYALAGWWAYRRLTK